MRARLIQLCMIGAGIALFGVKSGEQRSSSPTRDAFGNFWALAPVGWGNSQLLVLPAQDPTRWVVPEVSGLTPSGWQAVTASEDAFVWLTKAGRSVRFDLHKLPAGLTEAAMPSAAPAFSIWRRVARMPVSNHDLTAAVLNSKFYVAGGLTAEYGFPARSQAFDELWELNPKTWVWRAAAKLARARIYCATAAFDGKIWVIGGDVMEADGSRHAVTTVELYDPRTGRLTAGPEPQVMRPMPLALAAAGRLYVLGNARGEYDQPGRLESIGVGETTWRREPNGPTGMGALSGTVLEDKLYVAVPKTGLAVYDPRTRRWDVIESFYKPRSCQMAAYRGEVWLMGGQDIADQRQTLIYNPRTRDWRVGTQLPKPLSWGAAEVVDGRLILTGGAALRSKEDRVYVYSDQTFLLEEPNY